MYYDNTISEQHFAQFMNKYLLLMYVKCYYVSHMIDWWGHMEAQLVEALRNKL